MDYNEKFCPTDGEWSNKVYVTAVEWPIKSAEGLLRELEGFDVGDVLARRENAATGRRLVGEVAAALPAAKAALKELEDLLEEGKPMWVPADPNVEYDWDAPERRKYVDKALAALPRILQRAEELARPTAEMLRRLLLNEDLADEDSREADEDHEA